MNPQELGRVIGVDPKNIRKFARKLWNSNGSWDFNQTQVEVIKDHFRGTPIKTATAVAAPKLPPVTEARWDNTVGLTLIAKEFLAKEYGLSLNIPIKINGRLSRSLGRFRHYASSKKPIDIEMSQSVISNYGKEITIDVLKHELVHYALYMLGRNFKDGDADFENELKRLGIGRTHTYGAKGEFHIYICKGCGEIVSNNRRAIPTHKIWQYKSKCCGAPIEYAGKKTL